MIKLERGKIPDELTDEVCEELKRLYAEIANYLVINKNPHISWANHVPNQIHFLLLKYSSFVLYWVWISPSSFLSHLHNDIIQLHSVH